MEDAFAGWFRDTLIALGGPIPVIGIFAIAGVFFLWLSYKLKDNSRPGAFFCLALAVLCGVFILAGYSSAKADCDTIAHNGNIGLFTQDHCSYVTKFFTRPPSSP